MCVPQAGLYTSIGQCSKMLVLDSCLNQREIILLAHQRNRFYWRSHQGRCEKHTILELRKTFCYNLLYILILPAYTPTRSPVDKGVLHQERVPCDSETFHFFTCTTLWFLIKFDSVLLKTSSVCCQYSFLLVKALVCLPWIAATHKF